MWTKISFNNFVRSFGRSWFGRPTTAEKKFGRYRAKIFLILFSGSVGVAENVAENLAESLAESLTENLAENLGENLGENLDENLGKNLD